MRSKSARAGTTCSGFAQLGARRHYVDGGLRRRRGAVGLKGEAARRSGRTCSSARRASSVPVYGSGGFTAYSEQQLCEQLAGWVDDGIPRVKMKVGRDPEARPAARRGRASSDRRERGAVRRRERRVFGATSASDWRRSSRNSASRWFEEPVYREDYEGTRFVREHAPAGMEISSGEYGYGLVHFRADARRRRRVDVLQADATRCGGFQGLLAVDGLCAEHHDAALDALRAASAPARCNGLQAAAAYRVFFRPRSHRAHAFRRRRRAGKTASSRPDPTAPGHRLGIQARRRRALRDLRDA